AAIGAPALAAHAHPMRSLRAAVLSRRAVAAAGNVAHERRIGFGAELTHAGRYGGVGREGVQSDKQHGRRGNRRNREFAHVSPWLVVRLLMPSEAPQRKMRFLIGKFATMSGALVEATRAALLGRGQPLV